MSHTHPLIALSGEIIDNDIALRRLPSVEAQLIAWLGLADAQQVSRCLYLQRGGYSVYVRRSIWDLPQIGPQAGTLDIASVTLSPRLRGKGWFRCFLEIADALNPWDATYVEAVQNERLAEYLIKAGYKSMEGRSFYRPSKRWREQQSIILADHKE